jgi:hypothetical protein
MANKMKDSKMNRLRSSSLSTNLSEDRLRILEVEGANDVENMDLTYSSYGFTKEEKVETKPEVVEEHDDIDSLVEYIKNVDAAFVKEKKTTNHSVAERIIAANKDKPKMKRSEMLCDYSSQDTFDINNVKGSLSSIDYYLGALKDVKENND